MNKLKAYSRLARPHQYIKNGFVLLPMLFGHKLTHFETIIHSLAAMAIFCLAASSVYAFNDIRDIESDKAHPVKRNRPLPGGFISITGARLFGLVLLTLSLAGSIILFDFDFFLIIISYLVLNLAYSLGLKHVAIVDVSIIAIGFVLRVFAGGEAAGLAISNWLIIMTFLLALFLGLSKRLGDLDLAEDSVKYRDSLADYNSEFISRAMSIMAAVVIVAYIQYTLSLEVMAKHGSGLYITSLWVVMGLLRYLQLALVKGKTAAPTMVLIKDIFLQSIICLWIVHWLAAIYG